MRFSMLRKSRVVRWFVRGVLVCLAFILALLWWLSHRLNSTALALDESLFVAARSETSQPLGGGLDGFASPYLGHTGSWNGKGGTMWGGSKAADMDREVAMGLRWTFMPVYWRVLEPDGPVTDLSEPPAEWRELDGFVIAAHQRKLNILMQAPVVGGNAGGPPDWAGRRAKGKSAPEEMQAAANFAGRLARRYAPGGTLATEQGWGDEYGVRAWELDNEPESYRTNWKGQAGDYAQFATLASQAIRAHDPQAVIVAPGCAGGGHGDDWIRAALDGDPEQSSSTYANGDTRYSLGDAIDVASFHVYEGLDSLFGVQPRTVERVFDEQREIFSTWAAGAGGRRGPQAYWHTEGNYDFLGLTSEKRRAAWRWQFCTRAFAAGVDKVCVMDAGDLEQTAMKTYVAQLPNPFPMQPADDRATIISGEAMVFLHTDNPSEPTSGKVWIAWAKPGTGGAELQIPVQHAMPRLLHPDGESETADPTGGNVRLALPGDKSLPTPVMLVDRPGGSAEP